MGIDPKCFLLMFWTYFLNFFNIVIHVAALAFIFILRLRHKQTDVIPPYIHNFWYILFCFDSYDARGESGTHQPNNGVLSTRGNFITRTDPARLILNPVHAIDQGLYTCRVDYITSPTHNTVINLTVIGELIASPYHPITLSPTSLS